MHTAIYSSQDHQSIVDVYLTLCKQFVQEVTTQSRYNNYLEVVDIIIEYSNGYGQGVRENGTFYDWLMILPINLSVATNGFFAGIETKSNGAVVRAYKVVLDQMLQETVSKLDLLEPTND
jgi:hypothetical protein|tara:strand:+ start:833 stop:1192 length:360 start_codon:yes stop_codon:yes gene_type:complete